MENETYEQIQLSEEIVGDQGEFLKPSQEVQIVFHNGNPLSVVMPPHVTMQVISSPPAVKGNTSTNATKVVTLESGVEVNVPLFIDEGEFVKIDIRTREYIERVKQ